MSPLTPARWAHVAALFDDALERPPDARAAFLDAACVGADGRPDAALRAEVEALLAADAAADADPAFQDAARFEAVLPEASAAGRRVGPYRLLDRLGEGGMGTVYLAARADGQFEQRVALKLIRPGVSAAEARRRFLAERQTLARLQHPNVAHLLDGGVTADGQPWFAMEHVEGAPITAHADARRLGLGARLDLFLQVCEAVAHAHAHHVVHRDLKPSNILVTEGGQVKLLDFGIARLLDPDGGDAALSRTGLHAMTPEYAVPEQLRGEAITPAADVYALGLILYELLTGHHAYRFTRASTAEIARVVCEEEPARPSAAAGRDEAAARARATTPERLHRRLRGDLDAICLKALEKAPRRRYASAEALAADLRRHLTGLPVTARRATLPYRALRFSGRHRAGAAAALGVLCLGAALALLGTGSRRPAAEASVIAVAPGVATRSAIAHRLYEEGLRTFQQHDLDAARRLFRASLAEDSAFALAAYHALRTERAQGLPPDPALESHLRRLTERLPARTGLLMRALWAQMEEDPSQLALAESLAARYPDGPEGHLLLGQMLVARGDLARARAHLRRVVAMDTAGLAGTAPRCYACDAFGALVVAHTRADALPAAEQVAREWVRRRPQDVRAWFSLAGALEYQGRAPAALAAMRQTSPLQQTTPYLPIYPAILAIRKGDFAAADRLLREQAQAGSPDVQIEALWFLAISLRYQGRFREALETTRALRRLRADEATALAEAQVLLEMGRAREAAARFDSLAERPPGGALAAAPAARGHRRSFALTHLAAARVAAGDASGLGALADTIEALGSRTLSEQRRRLHHHVRGLVLAREGRLAEAETAFRRAMPWPNNDYTRTNLELARVLLDLERPREAIPILQAAFRGSLETTRLYVTHTELHALLGRAYEDAGEPDSAAAHYAWALRAWAHADPALHAPREVVRRQLDALRG